MGGVGVCLVVRRVRSIVSEADAGRVEDLADRILPNFRS